MMRIGEEAGAAGVFVVALWYGVWALALACSAWCSPAGVCL